MPVPTFFQLIRGDRDVWRGAPHGTGGGRPGRGTWLRVAGCASLVLLFIAVLNCVPRCRHPLAAFLWGRPPHRVSVIPDEILVPLPPPTPDELLVHALRQLGAVDGPRGEVLGLPGLTFQLGRDAVTLHNENHLDAVIALLGRYPQINLVIEGYTDNSGSRLRNILLSLERAGAVRGMLVKRSVNESRLLIRGMGSLDPVASNSTPDGRAKNRRIEIVFSDTEGRFALGTSQGSTG